MHFSTNQHKFYFGIDLHARKMYFSGSAGREDVEPQKW
jgi:hypothetical protein